jgi:hypothetical protein
MPCLPPKPSREASLSLSLRVGTKRPPLFTFIYFWRVKESTLFFRKKKQNALCLGWAPGQKHALGEENLATQVNQERVRRRPLGGAGARVSWAFRFLSREKKTEKCGKLTNVVSDKFRGLVSVCTDSQHVTRDAFKRPRSVAEVRACNV